MIKAAASTIDVHLLNDFVKQSKYEPEELAKELDLSINHFRRKLLGKQNWTNKEISLIKIYLELSPIDIDKIFFSKF